MRKVYTGYEGQRVPIKSWCTNLEQGALDQAIAIVQLPFVFKHMSLAPDAHLGYGCPIGGIVATENVIVPNFVGCDISCGMITMKTNWKIDITSDFTKDQRMLDLQKAIKRSIPTGFKHNDLDQDNLSMAENFIAEYGYPSMYSRGAFVRACAGQGVSLGQGNHFLEIQHDPQGNVWVMIHSGSRNIGATIAKYHHAIAVELCQRWHSDIPNKDLSFLPLDSAEGQTYFDDMTIAGYFAQMNRDMMMDKVAECMIAIEDVEELDRINIHHNYASMENHFGKNVLVHRKGATRARKGERGIIPGSMGSKSYIVEGLGNPESFCSCSHGAGRALGRKEAKRSLDMAEESRKMDGILHSMTSKDKLDEAPGSYKDISVVMANQADLVKPIVELSPILSIKG